MKKYFKLAAVAVVALSLTVACKSKAVEEPVDTTPMIEEIVDTLVEEVAEEVVEPVKEAVKTTAKKANTQMKETKEVVEDVNANAKSRMAKKEGERIGVTEGTATKDGSTPDINKNAENRMKKR